MTVLSVGLAAVLAASQGASLPNECVATALDPASLQLCQGEQAAKRASDARDGLQTSKLLETAAAHYRRAADLGSTDIRLRALTALAATYDSSRLNDPIRRETVLRELIALAPLDPGYAFELAALQEPDGNVKDARVVKSIPLLDDAALKAVRDWRFEPTIIEGRAVPVRMVVTVNFTLSR